MSAEGYVQANYAPSWGHPVLENRHYSTYSQDTSKSFVFIYKKRFSNTGCFRITC
nr:unnamed protein product [Callosobruchus chinensis]CAH7715539.1 unnamed protein product [Callosobruchus chinensis]